MFVDSHIHLTHSLFEGSVPCIVSEKHEERVFNMDIKQIIAECSNNGIAFCIEPGIDYESNYRVLDAANEYPEYIFPAIGIHPTRAPQTRWSKRLELKKLALNNKVIAIGELGLDYHNERMKQHRFKQKRWFKWQLKLAWEKGLPLILHIRMADEDAIRILRRYKKKINGGVCHCFNQSTDIAKIYTEEFGLMLGIGGSLLQDNCKELEQAVIDTPLSYLILETDGPYVKPKRTEGVSGKKWKKARNTSLIIPDIAKRIAVLKGIDVLEVEKATTENVIKVFGINKGFSNDIV